MYVIHLMIDDSESSHFISKKARTGEYFILKGLLHLHLGSFQVFIIFRPSCAATETKKKGGIILTCYFILFYSRERHNSCKNEKRKETPLFFFVFTAINILRYIGGKKKS